MLGTGDAATTRCYNTCFTLQTPGTTLLVDGGGGNGILVQLEKAGLKLTDLDAMFVTHSHTDHIFGAVWIIRMMTYVKDMKKKFPVFGNYKVIFTIQSIISLTFNEKDIASVENKIDFHELKDGERFKVGDINLQCFDIHSTKAMQFGFRATLPDGKTLTCLGDEPYNEANKNIVESSDWLMHEAFCLYADRDKFRPYEKHHSTALDAGKDAVNLNVKNLILYHTEDSNLSERKTKYTAEAKSVFNGNVYVPDDLETINL